MDIQAERATWNEQEGTSLFALIKPGESLMERSKLSQDFRFPLLGIVRHFPRIMIRRAAFVTMNTLEVFQNALTD
jgi:hypothetical protein